MSQRHPRVREVRETAATLDQHWEELRSAVAARGRGLEDHRDLLEFLQKVEEVEAWIRSKVCTSSWFSSAPGFSPGFSPGSLLLILFLVLLSSGFSSPHGSPLVHVRVCVCVQEVMVAVGDLGSDYEHGVELVKKLSDFRGHSSLAAGVGTWSPWQPPSSDLLVVVVVVVVMMMMMMMIMIWVMIWVMVVMMLLVCVHMCVRVCVHVRVCVTGSDGG